MKNLLIIFFISFGCLFSFAQETSYVEEEISINKITDGTLTTPKEKAESLIIFIQGSGPTDRDGNQSMLKNDGIKKMARQLAKNGIASYRFDKRIFKMRELKIKEEDLVFEDFITDVNDIIAYFEEDDTFDNIILAGHSEGSLIGMLAAKDKADAFISLAGASKPIDSIIVEQFNKQAPQLGENARIAFNEIRENGKTSNYSPMLQAVFRPSVQPYLYSWIQYNPSAEIAKLDMPVLIVNGTADFQVSEEEAQRLKAANPEAKLVILERMNHVFRKIESDDLLVNSKSYNEPNQPLHPELISTLTQFIKELE